MTAEQKRISDEFMKLWHEELPQPLWHRREVQPHLSREALARGLPDDDRDRRRPGRAPGLREADARAGGELLRRRAPGEHGGRDPEALPEGEGDHGRLPGAARLRGRPLRPLHRGARHGAPPGPPLLRSRGLPAPRQGDGPVAGRHSLRGQPGLLPRPEDLGRARLQPQFQRAATLAHLPRAHQPAARDPRGARPLLHGREEGASSRCRSCRSSSTTSASACR
jgi:hypothetical protein